MSYFVRSFFVFVFLVSTTNMFFSSPAYGERDIDYIKKYDEIKNIELYLVGPTSNNLTEYIEFAKIAISKPFKFSDRSISPAYYGLRGLKEYAPKDLELAAYEERYYSRLEMLRQEMLKKSERKDEEGVSATYNLYLIHSLFSLKDSEYYNLEKAFEYLETSCTYSYILACKVAGDKYLYGHEPVEHDFNKARGYYWKGLAAEQHFLAWEQEYLTKFESDLQDIRENLALISLAIDNNIESLVRAIGFVARHHDERFNNNADLIRVLSKRLAIAEDGNKTEDLYRLTKDIRSGNYSGIQLKERVIRTLLNQALDSDY
ncbi:hypothetical protein [Candidatus Enterovibrio escicola]|uniref:hypothetical protein n=1 Tax=Candidatus Enterovibrio escicola TaxID=1927127 RepID=UPI001237BCEC|nr:hypothetical protein [Candidatus Enterovibrio escacola]